MKKQHILDEIKRTAQANGVALGVARFFAETGIKESDWRGRYWARWGDALREAGFAPNALQAAYDDAELIECLAALIREIGHFPVYAELKMKRQSDRNFPSSDVFSRFGSVRQIRSRVAEYCASHSGFDDIIPLCVIEDEPDESDAPETSEESEQIGFIYLLRSGRHYKIGKTNALGRRERELAIQLPEKARTVHFIKTDDPEGIEKYWHQRFAGKRTNGEWFELDQSDVSAFKRRKFM